MNFFSGEWLAVRTVKCILKFSNATPSIRVESNPHQRHSSPQLQSCLRRRWKLLQEDITTAALKASVAAGVLV